MLAYERRDDATGRRLLVALNLGARPRALRGGIAPGGRVLLSAGLDRAGEAIEDGIELRPDDAVVVERA